MWFNLAAAQGDKKASYNRDEIERYMTFDQITQAQRRAREWKPMAPSLASSTQGNANAQPSAGHMFASGEWRDYGGFSAYDWLNLAAARSSEEWLEDRDSVAKQLNTAEIGEAQRLARESKPTKPGGSLAFNIQDKRDRPRISCAS